MQRTITHASAVRSLTLLLTIFAMVYLGGCSNLNAPVPTEWSALSTGYAHSCAIEKAGKLWCWGNSEGGRLGVDLGDELDAPELFAPPRSLPERVNSETWSMVSAGYSHTCGIQESGSLWCWGKSSSGELGADIVTHRLRPERVGESSDWATVAAGGSHTCAIKHDGSLWCWGRDMSGEVGVGTKNLRYLTPQRVGSASNWRALSAGHSHTCATTGDGSLWCWGSGKGIGVDTDDQIVPWQIGADSDWREISSGHSHNCGIRQNGTLWCWGAGAEGRLGLGDELDRNSPEQVGSATNWSRVSAHFSHTCASRDDHTLWCWGAGASGRLGLGDVHSRNVPERVEGALKWAQVSAGGGHSCGIGVDQEMRCWGANTLGQLGTGVDGGAKYFPVPMESTETFHHISTGSEHSCGVDEDSALWCWGSGKDGRTGLGDESPRSSPERVDPGSSWQQVALGDDHSCGIKRTGTLWCWGRNTYGQLGVGDRTVARKVPEQVDADGAWSAVTAGRGHSCAIRSDGTLWCWGANGRGQLGLGGGGHREIPQQVGDASDWTLISAGQSHTCGIRADGTLWCWGEMVGGKLGLGPLRGSYLTTPRQVGEATDWVQVSAGFNHTCGRSGEGTLWCWGAGGYGALGQGDQKSHPSPTQVGSDTDWIDVSAGYQYTCAVHRAGTLWCWGDAARGGLGILSKEKLEDFYAPDIFSPYQVGTDSNWRAVRAGQNTTHGLRSSGEGWSWGGNSQGQLGDGGLWRTSPVKVGAP